MIPISDDIPGEQFPIVTLMLIMANVAIFLLEVMLGPYANAFIQTFGIIPLQISQQWYNPFVLTRLFTAMYLHGGWSHLLGNMLYLWIFGNNVEDRMGKVRFFTFYTLCGILSGLAEVIAAPSSEIPGIGASGAIAGVLGAYMLLYPRARVQMLIPLPFWFATLYVPALLVLGGWFIIQFFNGIASLGITVQTGGIAWWAHIGGFIVGMILMPIFRQRRLPPRTYYYRGGPY